MKQQSDRRRRESSTHVNTVDPRATAALDAAKRHLRAITHGGVVGVDGSADARSSESPTAL